MEEVVQVFFHSLVLFSLGSCCVFLEVNGFSTLLFTFLIPDGLGGGDGLFGLCCDFFDIIIGSSKVFLFN